MAVVENISISYLKECPKKIGAKDTLSKKKILMKT